MKGNLVDVAPAAQREVKKPKEKPIKFEIGGFVRPKGDTYDTCTRSRGYIGVVHKMYIDGDSYLRVVGVYDNDFDYDNITACYDVIASLFEPYFPSTAELGIYHEYLQMSKALGHNPKQCEKADQYVLEAYN